MSVLKSLSQKVSLENITLQTNLHIKPPHITLLIQSYGHEDNQTTQDTIIGNTSHYFVFVLILYKNREKYPALILRVGKRE